MQKSKLTYEESGVDYSKIDPCKISAQYAAQQTAANIADVHLHEVSDSRGESAHVIDMGEYYLASVCECLGTKSLVADAMLSLGTKTYYDNLAIDTVAMAVNDIITVGARPLVVHAYWAVGGNQWFEHTQRMADLISGWQTACSMAGACWGGGETPCLSGIISLNAIDLAASCVGMIQPKHRMTLGSNLQPQDSIILLESSGIHANGITLARNISSQINDGYATMIADNLCFGEALLEPTIIYAPVMEALFAAQIPIHYCANITGHGWRKIMRHKANLTYRIHSLVPVPPVLQFIAKQANLSSEDAYGSLNMGAGFALFLPSAFTNQALDCIHACGIKAYHAGVVESGPKQLIIEPLSITFKGESLSVRL